VVSEAVSHHYVPQWYQKRFIRPESCSHKVFYLDLAPTRMAHPDGSSHVRRALRYLGPAKCFEASNLYALAIDGVNADILERRFFGNIDREGREAVEFFADFRPRGKATEHCERLLQYMDIQTSRTPKGLDRLKRVLQRGDHQDALALMQALFQVNCTIWSECVWEVIQCDKSPVKFIVSDHPVTTYNRGLFPGSERCRYPLDAPIELLGTHTIFPLGLTRCLVLTNLGFVRDPRASLIKRRENPRYFQPAILDVRTIQTGREVPVEYVLAINYILKNRARRYIAAAEKDWLFPEHSLQTTHWNKLGGDKYFLHPDPRKVHFTTDSLMTFQGGGVWGSDEYGRPPREDDIAAKQRRDREWMTFQHAKTSWDSAFGKLSREELHKALFPGED
jgi:hypothetical protein